MPKRTNISKVPDGSGVLRRGWLIATVIGLAVNSLAADPLSIKLSHHTVREMQTAQLLKKVVSSYDLTKYIYTREVIIDERAITHAFPVLTLNARFADSPDELLSSFVHEQLHWYLREHHVQTEDAIAQLRRFYPRVPWQRRRGNLIQHLRAPDRLLPGNSSRPPPDGRGTHDGCDS